MDKGGAESRLSRRQFVISAGVASAALLVRCGQPSLQAPPPPKVHRLGWLAPGGPGSPSARGFLQGMTVHGYEEGRNLAIDWHTFDGRSEAVAEQMAELVSTQPDLIVTGSNFPALAAKAVRPQESVVMRPWP